MGFIEATEDGIRHDSHGFMTAYYPPCSRCGEEVKSLSYLRGIKYVCQKCKTDEYFSDKATRVALSSEAKERKFENAVSRIRKVVRYDCKYTTAAEKVHSKLHRDGWFDSTEEIMVAIELVRRNIKTRHQVKFGRYRADFVLTDEKVVLEVDGRVFHAGRSDRERLRDELIILALGAEWEVVRITDDLVNQNISRLMPAIRKTKERRAFYRKQYGGKLPDWYSDKAV